MPPPKFTVGSSVFVKMRGYPAWPAKVEGIADETPNKIKYHIFFYGTKQIAVCKEEDMCCYLKFRESLGKPKKAKGFNEGILDMDKELGLVCLLKNAGVEKSADNIQESSDNITDNVGPETEKNDSYQQLMSILQIESQLVKINYGIQNSLNLKEADTDACLGFLKELSNLNLNKLMIKKHPEIVYTLIQLQKYVGNTGNWNMTEGNIKKFELKAKQIQEEAKIICIKLQKMFNFPHGCEFSVCFEKELSEFKEMTKQLSLEDFFRLTRDPTNT